MDDHGVGDAFLPVTSVASGKGKFVSEDVYYYPVQIVNVCFIGSPSGSGWVLVDAGMPRSAEKIIAEAEKVYGKGKPPEAIILTHGHFDHIGAAVELVEHWQVPVYAHTLELPYLTGKEDYPEPDMTVEGGMVAKMSGMFPNEGIDLGTHIHPLPTDHTVPELPGWEWILTPGHSPGHISLFRQADKTLIAGDAFVTVQQESLYKVITQTKELNGPPRYLTTDWNAAKRSVQQLSDLEPALAVCGHGVPVEGEELRKGLSYLAAEFDMVARPDYGKYVDGEDQDGKQ